MKTLGCSSSQLDSIQEESDPALWSNDSMANEHVNFPYDCLQLIFSSISRNSTLTTSEIRNFFLTCRRTYELRLQYLQVNDICVSQLLRRAHFPTETIPRLLERSIQSIGHTTTKLYLDQPKQDDSLSSVIRMFSGFHPFGENWLRTVLNYFPNLKELYIRNIRVTDAHISELSGFPLEAFGVDNTDLTDKGLVKICKITTLKALNLYNSNFSEEGICQIFSNFNRSRRNAPKIKLTSIEIVNCPGLTNRSLSAIVSSQKHLNLLYLRQCSKITNAAMFAVEQVYKRSDTLTTIDIRGCPNLTDGSLIYLSNIRSITSLNIGLCKKMSCHAIAKLTPMVDTLRFISLSRLPLTNKAVHNLRPFKQLESVDLSNCKSVSRLESTVGELPNLKYVKISGTSINLTDQANLKKRFPGIEFI